MNIWEQIQFRKHHKLNAGYNQIKELMASDSKAKIRAVPAPYTPIRPDDLPLDKLLKEKPQYQYLCYRKEEDNTMDTSPVLGA